MDLTRIDNPKIELKTIIATSYLSDRNKEMWYDFVGVITGQDALSIVETIIDDMATLDFLTENLEEKTEAIKTIDKDGWKEIIKREKEYINTNKYWSWPDGHPKNIFVNQKGEVAFIDFGYSQWADQRFILPSHLAHIVIYSLAGCIEKDLAKDYILRCIDTFKKIEPINEDIFCRYLAMEVFHRANGKWVVGIETKEQKLALLKFGFTVFDEKINTINQLTDLLLK